MDIRKTLRAVSSPLAAAAATLAVGVSLLEPSVAMAGPAVIEGQMFDRDGRPLRGQVVRLIEVRSGPALPFVEKEDSQQEVFRAETDAHGMFRFELSLERRKGRLWVRCYDKPNWDHVRYDAPEDVDVTYDAYERGTAIVTCAVDDAPAWTELVREIDRAGGAATRRGAILRTHGLPPEIRNESDGRVRWVYAHVEYVFDEERLVETIEKPRVVTQSGAAS